VPLRNIYYQTFIYDPYILFVTKLVIGFRFCYLGFRFTVPLFYDQPIKKIDFFHYPRVSTGDLPLTKKLGDSGYEIGGIIERNSPKANKQKGKTWRSSILGKFTELYIFHQGLAVTFFSMTTFPMMPTFQLCWFGWNRPPHFFKNTFWNWSVFACLINLCNGGVVKVSPLAGFKLNGHKSRLSKLKRLIITGCGVCFLRGLLVPVKLIFKVG